MLGYLSKALSQLGDPVLRRVLLIGVAGSALVFILLNVLVWWVFSTTLGSTDGKEYWDIIDAAWARVMRKDPHGTASHTVAQLKQAFMARLHAVLTQYTARHIHNLSRGT